MYKFPVFLYRTKLTRSEAYRIVLLVGEMYLQVEISSLFTTDLASFTCYCKMMLGKSL